MLAFAIVFFLFLAAPQQPSVASNEPGQSDVFAPFALYQGTWQATPGIAGMAVDVIANQCHEFTEYFACQQTVNGKVGALVVYVYAGTAGHYNTHAILPTGVYTGPGDLVIEGNRWTFSGKTTHAGNTTYYRTINDWSGHDRIHFEVAHSTDDKTWVVDHKGDERRMVVK